MGEDVSEVVELVPAYFVVQEHHRPSTPVVGARTGYGPLRARTS